MVAGIPLLVTHIAEARAEMSTRSGWCTLLHEQCGMLQVMPGLTKSSIGAMGMLCSLSCHDPAPTHAPSEATPRPQGSPTSQPPDWRTCASAAQTVAIEDEARALGSLLSASPRPPGFSCPGALQVFQREPWYLPVAELAAGEPDGLEGPSPRAMIGERVSYWGLEPRTGDMLIASLGRVDQALYSRARAAVSEDTIELARVRDPEFELPEDATQLDLGVVLEGPWRGLTITAMSGQRASALRAWLADRGGPNQVLHRPLGSEQATAPDQLDELPWVLGVADDAGLTLCVGAAETSRCWSCDALELLELRHDWATSDELDPGLLASLQDDEDEEHELAILTLRTRSSIEIWQLHLSTGTWWPRGEQRLRSQLSSLGGWPPVWRGSPLESDAPVPGRQRRSGPGSLVFEVSTSPPSIPDELDRTWFESLTPSLVVGGSYQASAMMPVPEVELVMKRTEHKWQAGQWTGGEFASLLESPDSAAIVLVTGSESYANDSLGFAGYDLSLLTPTIDRAWLRPAGHLPLPLAAMAQYGHSGGWGYAYEFSSRGGCLSIELDHAIWWTASGDQRPLELPFDDLDGEWSIGVDGLSRSCAAP